MKLFFTCIAMCILLLSIASAHTPAQGSESFVDVWRSDGSLQCGDGPTRTLDETVAEVEAAGIEMVDARSIHDGRKRVARCGAPTGQMHVLSIGYEDLSGVEALGFVQVPSGRS